MILFRLTQLYCPAQNTYVIERASEIRLMFLLRFYVPSARKMRK